jgi:hypothetical protein
MASSFLSNLSASLGSLPYGGLRLLGNHLTQSQEMQAMSILDAMEANPMAAPSELAALTALFGAGAPATVMNYVQAAMIQTANIPAFIQNITQAKVELTKLATSPDLLGRLFPNL